MNLWGEKPSNGAQGTVAPGPPHLCEGQLCSMRPAALTSALAQKLSLPTLLISDMALVFWYTEPCGEQRIHYGAALGSTGHQQQPWGQCPASSKTARRPWKPPGNAEGVSGCTRPLRMEARPPASDS